MKKRTALRLIKTVWENQKYESWDGVNHSMQCAMVLAIGANLEFSPRDFGVIIETMGSGYWSRWDDWYALAISVGNRSFIAAYEAYQNWEPFLANRVRPVFSREFTHMTGTRARERLAIGFDVEGYGEVTSINRVRVVVTSRHPRKIHRFTHDDLKRLFPAPKKAKTREPKP